MRAADVTFGCYLVSKRLIRFTELGEGIEVIVRARESVWNSNPPILAGNAADFSQNNWVVDMARDGWYKIRADGVLYRWLWYRRYNYEHLLAMPCMKAA